MSLVYVVIAIFLDFLRLVHAKTCLRSDNIYETFTCGMYEYCCGTRCCRSPIITFYQMWYFWLMVFLTILFCSGGGWWYRLRNQDAYITPSMAQRGARPIIHPARGPTIIAATMPMPMPMHPPATYNMQQPPPPPYYGPPPSYDTVINQHPNQQNLHPNQQNLHPNQQNQNRAPTQQN